MTDFLYQERMYHALMETEEYEQPEWAIYHEVLIHLMEAQRLILAAKGDGRNELARRYRVALTDLEKVYSYVDGFVSRALPTLEFAVEKVAPKPSSTTVASSFRQEKLDRIFVSPADLGESKRASFVGTRASFRDMKPLEYIQHLMLLTDRELAQEYRDRTDPLASFSSQEITPEKAVLTLVGEMTDRFLRTAENKLWNGVREKTVCLLDRIRTQIYKEGAGGINDLL